MGERKEKRCWHCDGNGAVPSNGAAPAGTQWRMVFLLDQQYIAICTKPACEEAFLRELFERLESLPRG